MTSFDGHSAPLGETDRELPRDDPPPAAPPTSQRLLAWQLVVLTLLVAGYSGCYLCRSNFSVSLNLIAASLVESGYESDQARIHLGTIASLGTLAYALGKFVTGSLADFLGGRRNILVGMFGSVVCTLAFAAGGSLPIFTLAWIGNRALQSLCWTGMVKITGKWFSYSSYGLAMGTISLSYLFGDAAARAFMSQLLERGFFWRELDRGFSWRQVFVVAAGVLFALVVASWLWLRETPLDIGEPEPPANPANVYGQTAGGNEPTDLRSLLLPLVTSPQFLVVCLLSLGLTLLRETFLVWTPAYFADVLGSSHADAALQSALFPLSGGVAVLGAGWLGDRLGRGGRAGGDCRRQPADSRRAGPVGLRGFSLRFAGAGLADGTGGLRHARAIFLPGRSDLARPGRQARRRHHLWHYRRRRISWGHGGRRQRRPALRAIWLVGGPAGISRRGAGDQPGGLGVSAHAIADGPMNVVDEICQLFATRGHAAYVGEPVSQLEHALQAAWHAEQEGADDALVVAALVHDVGHLLTKAPEDAADHGIDTRHEALGERWLARSFGPEVTEPVRLHVPAKRYLCTTDAAYQAQLSPASLQSLALQGGPLTGDEVRQFEAQPHFRGAVRLRRWDDLAKVPGMEVPPIEHYRARLERAVVDREAGNRGSAR